MLKPVFLILALLATPIAVAGLPPASDLAQDAEKAKQARLPILVFFTSDSCPYCQEVLELYLEPMHDRGVYSGRLLMRYVEVTSGTSVRDFDGRRTDHERFAAREGAFITPMIRFYDYTGRELVPPIIGYSSRDFFAGDLEEAIERSIARAQAGGAAGRARAIQRQAGLPTN